MSLTVELYIDSSWTDISDNIVRDSFPEWFVIGFKGAGNFDFEAKGASFILENYDKPDRYTQLRVKRGGTAVFEGYIDRVEWESEWAYTINFHPYSLLLKDCFGRYSEYGMESESGYPDARAGVESFSDILDDIVYEINDDVDELIPGFSFSSDADAIRDDLYDGFWGIVRIAFSGEAVLEDWRDHTIHSRWHIVSDDADDPEKGNLYFVVRNEGGDSYSEFSYNVYTIGSAPLFQFLLLHENVGWSFVWAEVGDVYQTADFPWYQEIINSLPKSDNREGSWEIALCQSIVALDSEVPVYYLTLRRPLAGVVGENDDEEPTYQYFCAVFYRTNGFQLPAGNHGGSPPWSKILKIVAMASDSYYFVDGDTIYFRGQEETPTDTWSVTGAGILQLKKKIGVTYSGQVDLELKKSKVPGTEEGLVIPWELYDSLEDMYDLRTAGEWEEYEIVALADDCTDLQLLAGNDTYGQIFEMAYHMDGFRVRIRARRRVE